MMRLDPYRHVSTPDDSIVIMSASSVIERRSGTVTTLLAPDGHDANEGVVSYGGLPMRAIVVDIDHMEPPGDPGYSEYSVRIQGTDALGDPITEDITLDPQQTYRIGLVDFYTITGSTLLAAPGGSDSSYSVGTRYVQYEGTSGYNAVAFRGALATDRSAAVNPEGELALNGPFTPWTPGASGEKYKVDFAGMGISDATVFIIKLSNTASRTFRLNDGTLEPEELVLPVGAGTEIQGQKAISVLNAIVVIAGTSSSPFVDIGCQYREAQV